jgi:hypothetical protein
MSCCTPLSPPACPLRTSDGVLAVLFQSYSQHTHLSPFRLLRASARLLSVAPTSPRSTRPVTGTRLQGAPPPSATASRPLNRDASASALCMATTWGRGLGGVTTIGRQYPDKYVCVWLCTSKGGGGGGEGGEGGHASGGGDAGQTRQSDRVLNGV